MHYTAGNPAELTQKFWHAMVDSPIVMLQLDADADSAAPMTALLDKDADHAIWYFTRRDSRFASLGPATAIFASKSHELFARFHGTLSVETSRDRLEKQWSPMAKAWFPRGKDDPDLLMLRMDLGAAAIWSGELGLLGMARLMLGMDVSDEMKGSYAETRI